MTSPPLRRTLVQVVLSVALFAAIPAAGQVPGDTLDVLFLGNSYIYFNNLPGLVEGISHGLEGPILRAGSHTHGGFTLRRHLEDGHVPDALSGAPGARGWDRVVLQEQSSLGTAVLDAATGQLGSPGDFHQATRDFAHMIRETGAEPVLFMTWAKQRFPAQIADLADAYGTIGSDLGFPVAAVGAAWAEVGRQRPGIVLHLRDGSHPTPAGSYLAACVLYATLTGRSPVGAPREIRGRPWDVAGPVVSQRPTILVSLSAEDAAFLQRVAWETVVGQGRD